MKEILPNTKIIYKDKTYVGNEIQSHPEIFKKLSQNMLLYPASFLKKVKDEKGFIQLTFNNDGTVNKTLSNVSTELLGEFHSIYQ